MNMMQNFAYMDRYTQQVLRIPSMRLTIVSVKDDLV